MKGILPLNRWALLHNGATAAGTDRIMTEVDTGGAENGTLVIVADFAAGSDVNNVEVWTSTVSDFATAGTALSAVPSDGTAQVTIVSDTSNFFAEGTLGGSISDVTVSGNKISALNQDGMYVLSLKGVSRYLNVQYDGDGTGSKLAVVFIGHDLPEAPWGGAQSSY